MKIGTSVKLSWPLKPGEATLVYIIEAGTIPSQETAMRFYGPKCPGSILRAPAEIDRLVFLRKDRPSYAIVPGSNHYSVKVIK
ncbi:hypothetical protein LCGC14_1630660 [marine sediment metagenome]|uniref:Uncharacterized protein n=1 Tax=marine sediment metagenome TaxID=412755 RepID=A0A0F9I2Q6_9ZZZZ